MSGSLPRRQDICVVLVVRHAEKVAEGVGDRRGDEAGPELDRLLVRTGSATESLVEIVSLSPTGIGN
jgi:hypothetical protein